MFLKLVSIYLLTISLANAVTISTSRHKLPDGNADIVLKYDADEVVNRNDWVAIYKQGDDSEVWNNVLNWDWVYKLKVNEPGGPVYVLRKIKLPVGEYQARFFKNNSYVIDQSVDFSIVEVDSYLTKINAYPSRPGLDKVENINFRGLTEKYLPNPKDWVALYDVNDSNDWKNVKDWAWARDVYKGWKVGDLPLANGNYEIRYFLNNTFTTFMKSRVFPVSDEVVPPRDDVSLEIEPYVNEADNYSVRINLKDSSLNPKNWIGFFKKGKRPIRKNLLKWTYNTLGQESGVIDLDLLPSTWKDETITAVLFENDTYVVLTKTDFVLP